MRLLDNPYHKDELWRLGVRPGTAFACGIEFLLRIRPEALEPHAAALEVVFRAACAVIAVHVPEQCTSGVLLCVRVPTPINTHMLQQRPMPQPRAISL